MNLTTFKSAQKIQNRLSEIALQLTLLSNEDNNYIMSFYDKTTMNENDGNPINPDNSNQKIKLFEIEGKLKEAIREQLFKEQQELTEQFNNL